MRKIGFANSQNGTLVGRFPPLTTYPEKIPNFGIDYREEYFFWVAAIAIFEDYQTNQLVKKVVKEMEVVTDIELSSMEDGKVYALENRMDYEIRSASNMEENCILCKWMNIWENHVLGMRKRNRFSAGRWEKCGNFLHMAMRVV
jgi:hypothetical protein